MSWRAGFDLASHLSNQQTDQANVNASVTTNIKTGATIKGGTAYHDGERTNSAHFTGGGAFLAGGALTLDDGFDLPAGWTADTGVVTMPYDAEGMFALRLDIEIVLGECTIQNTYPEGASLHAALVCHLHITDGFNNLDGTDILISNASLYRPEDLGGDGPLTIIAGTTNVTRQMHSPSARWGIAVEIPFFAGSDDIDGTVAYTVVATHIPITRFA